MSVKRSRLTHEVKAKISGETEAGKSIAQTAREQEIDPNRIPRRRSLRAEYAQQSIDNPYVGPVQFEQSQGDLFFGREQEAGILLSLAISERVVLFYAQSGAGKSSLVNTRLIPNLIERNYDVLPVVRVGALLPSAVDSEEIDNVYVFNTVLCLSRSQNPKSLLSETLDGFLGKIRGEKNVEFGQQGRRTIEDGVAPRYLIFDQFEEILTRHVEYWRKREEFFLQLRKALNEDLKLNVVFVLREDHLAGLDRYSSLTPEGLRVRYRMERLGHKAALEAIEGPAARRGRPFEPGVAQAIVEELAQLRMSDEETTFLGEFVEPMLLQIVCFKLWESLPTSEIKTITMDHWRQFGNTNKAISQFFEDGVRRVAERTSIPERKIRRWFGETLITTSRIRAQVDQERLETGGLPNEAVALLGKEHLIRVEEARGGKWVELAHDRFIGPILDSNKRFFLSAGESPLTVSAKVWQENDEDESLLLRGRGLIEAQKIFEDSPESFSNVESDFIAASYKAELERMSAQRRATRRLGALVVVLLISLSVAVWGWVKARNKRIEAIKNYDVAMKYLDESMYNLKDAAAERDKYRLLTEAFREVARLQSNQAGVAQQPAETVAEAATARRKIESRKDVASKAPITIKYYSRYIDPVRLIASLEGLGFKFVKEESQHKQIPTNTVWFGKDVDIEDIQLVALTLIRGGVLLTHIDARKADEPPEKWRIISIGGSHEGNRLPVISVGQILNLTKEGIPKDITREGVP